MKPLAVMQNDRAVDLFRSNDIDASLSALGEAIRLAPGLPSPRFNRGLVLSSKKDYEHAIADFDETLRLDPQHPKAHLFRGIAYRERGMLKPARADSAYVALGEKDKALADLDGALGAGYRSAGLYYDRGRMLADRNDPRACESFSQAAVLDKTDADALFERGLCNAKGGQLDWAVADFSEVIRLKPDRAQAWWNRGLCYGKQKKTGLASADRAQALKLDPHLAKKK